MVKNLSVLGSTGSIGTQALDVARRYNINITALAAMKNIARLEEQVREFKPELVAVYDESAAKELKIKISDTNTKVVQGSEGLNLAAGLNSSDMVLNSVVGMVGLKPTLCAIKEKKDIALANKETLVVGGKLVTDAAKENNVKILPVDSEHSAIFQCLQGMHDKKSLKKIILTASGGPFFGKSKSELKDITPQDALKHPTWNMGAKISIDSATMMNKGLEIIEAKWLFDVELEKIDVLVHRESIVHSLIEYNDNSVIAQLALPDMHLPIQYALTYPERCESLTNELDLASVGSLSFSRACEDTFLCLKACKEAIRRGGLAPAAANGANELAVSLFLQGKISFLDIGEYVYMAMKSQKDKEVKDIDDIIEADKQAREFVLSKLTKGR